MSMIGDNEGSGAGVSQRSQWGGGTTPFRYPGGKGFLSAELARRIEACSKPRPTCYAEPYAGGAGAAVQLLAQERVEHIYLNDCDWRIYAVWQSMLNETERFVDRVRSVPLDVETWRSQREIVTSADARSSSLFDVGFAAFYLNRTNRSGIIVGAGPIGGYEQTGNWKIDARFPRDALASRIRWISERRNQITLSNEDGLSFLKRVVPEIGTRTLFFIDPPYVTAGSRLYLNAMTELRHLDLAKFLIGNRGMPHWVVTYDDDPLIRSAYRAASVNSIDVVYTLQKRRAAGELLITPGS